MVTYPYEDAGCLGVRSLACVVKKCEFSVCHLGIL